MDRNQDELGRGSIAGIPSAGLVLAGVVMLAAGYLAFGNVSLTSIFGSAGSVASSMDGPNDIVVTGQEATYYIVAPANVRNRATAIGTAIVSQQPRGVAVTGIIELGENGSALWLRLADGSGYISATNLSSGEAVQTARPVTTARSLSFISLSGFDSYVRSSVPAAEWSNEPTILVGGWGDEYRGLIRFNIDPISEIANGDSVKLRLYARSPDDGTAFRPTSMAIYRASSSISNNTSWLNQPSIVRDTERLIEVGRAFGTPWRGYRR